MLGASLLSHPMQTLPAVPTPSPIPFAQQFPFSNQTLRFAWTLLILLAAVIWWPSAHAQNRPAGPADHTTAVSANESPLHEPRQALQAVQQRLETARTGHAEDALSDDNLNSLRQQTMQSHAQARDYAQSLSPRLSDLQSRLLELGDTPSDSPENTEVAQQREQITQAITQMETQNRLASLLMLDAEQTLETIATERRQLFQSHLWQRSPSLLTGRFWLSFTQNSNLDTQRGEALWSDLRTRMGSIPFILWILLLAWPVALIVLHRRLRHRLRRLASAKVPAGRLRRCLYAWSQILLASLTPFAIVGGIYTLLSWSAPLPDSVRNILLGLVSVAAYCGYTTGLGRALLAPNTPSWRLAPIPGATANALRHIPLWLALLLALNWLTEQFNQLLNTRIGLSILADSLYALATIAVLALALRHTRPRHGHDTEKNPGNLPAGTGTWVATLLRQNRTLIQTLLWGSLAFALGTLLVGYVVFAKFLLQQLIWFFTVIGTAYLLAATVSDIAALLIRSTAQAPQPASLPESPGGAAASPLVSQSPFKKWIVLGAGLAQASIALLAITLLLASFGRESLGFIGHMQYLQGHLQWGEVSIRPVAIVQALAFFLIGAALIQVVRRWLTERFLPATGLDSGVQTSLSTVAGYVGYVAVFATTLSVLGVGFEKVTWIASALSVGIGFGLQAIVQNFVSGLILLAERPVKVGDWVSLSGVEGDIRRINVRATEIQMSDRSTIIVPNSELITKMVRNITYADSMGRVQIKLAMPLDTPAETVRNIILAAFSEQEAILDNPAPNVYLDDITSSGLLFNATGFVASPRLAYRTRSALLFDILQRLNQAGVATSSPATMLLTTSANPPDSLD